MKKQKEHFSDFYAPLNCNNNTKVKGKGRRNESLLQQLHCPEFFQASAFITRWEKRRQGDGKRKVIVAILLLQTI